MAVHGPTLVENALPKDNDVITVSSTIILQEFVNQETDNKLKNSANAVQSNTENSQYPSRDEEYSTDSDDYSFKRTCKQHKKQDKTVILWQS